MPVYEKNDPIPEHLMDVYAKSTEGKSEVEKEAVAVLLIKYSDTFSKNEWDLGLTYLAEHPINTADAAPVKQRPRRVPLAYAEEEKKAIEDLLKKGVIQKSTSPWASPIVLVKNKSGAIRPCVDYRRVNALVKPDGFPLPRVQDCLDAVADSCLFSSFDLTSGYFQIPLKRKIFPKSAFLLQNLGHYEMTRLPFGLNNAAGTFQRTMELALQGSARVTCLVYIDDIIVFAKSFQEHIRRVDEVLARIKNAGLKLKPEKCNMLQTEVVFLGHVVSKEGIRPDPSNIAKVVQWPVPQNAKQVKQFVATGSYYRRFVQDFAKIARPLVDLTKKDAKFQWTVECAQAFTKLKQALVSPSVMGYPLNDGGDFMLDVDASGVGIGGVLSQIQGARERVIAYASRAMNKAERNYCITEQELLAVVYFVQYFRQYLLGRKFIVRTDHQALVWLFSLKEPSGKIARWIEILAQYNFQIEYRSGKKQGHCDALSRCPSPKECTCADIDMSEPLKCGPCKKCQRRAETMVLQPQTSDAPPAILSDTNMIQQTRSVTDNQQPGPSHEESEHQQPKISRSSSNWIGGRSALQIGTMQAKDSDISCILSAKLDSRKPSSETMVSCSPESRHYWVIWEALEVDNGVLCKHIKRKMGQTNIGSLSCQGSCDMRR